MEAGMVFMFILFVCLVVVAAIFGAIAARKRREELAQVAARLGLRFDPGHDHSLAQRFQFLNSLARGSNRYAFNVISGDYHGHPVTVFDYHYETHSTDSKGRRRTHHHYFSCFILLLQAVFPELRVYREGLFSKIGQFLGFEDIDFESAEFSRRYCVRSSDKRFAYDVCHARMIEYLLANEDLNLEIEANTLALAFGKRLSPAEIEPNLRRLEEIRALLPAYLFTARAT